MGRPRVFWAVLGVFALLNVVLIALPSWISMLVVIALFTGMWRAGKSALERRMSAA
jgi:hypothetical protein